MQPTQLIQPCEEIRSAKKNAWHVRLLRFLNRHGHWVIFFSLVLALVLWELAVQIWNFPTFILPRPAMVAERFGRAIADGSLVRNGAYTLGEVLLGLFAGSLVATILGTFLARSPLLDRLLSPYLVASQAIPIVAIAPLLVIWFGSGIYSKILICSLIVFFPVLVNTIVGLRAVPENLRDLMHSMHATPWQMLRFLELPAALPVMLGGLRIGATLSVIGAVVGEFVGSDVGLGFLINVARGQYDTAMVFVAVFTLIALALALYGLVILVEKRVLAWQNCSGDS